MKGLVGAFGFPYSWIFLPQYLLLVFLLWILMGTLSVNRFQSNLFYILYDIRLSSKFLWTFLFNVVFCVCSLLIFFSLNPMSILHELLDTYTVDKIDPTSEYVEMVKKYTLSITLGYIVLWNVIRRIYLTVRNTFDEPSRGPPPLFFNNLKVRRMANYEICAGKLFTR